ncbi:uncharacterized protein EAE98_011994 [Botrytis deweyae]|uniref:Uncharacterized protein n=1 Tax=Botrytis deweyae TaxID=2478750 RepID=A0ABQ7I4E6_9HELO|nr:uncharacterized protein EAE98_011994 [Botrytis deweyae]KAF7911524.1 hypothetical protein EAE98_011994 [Botrytis deweyae]
MTRNAEWLELMVIYRTGEENSLRSVQNHKWHSSRPSNEYIDVLDAHDNLKGGRSPGIER